MRPDSARRAELAAKAARFRELHSGPDILVLPNAWDAASARIFEEAGFPALATTSAGIAAAAGYPDGERISRDEMLDMVGRIARALSIPVTADMEAAYGDPESTARLVLEAGAVGLNFEDSPGGQLLDPAEHGARIQIMRRVAAEEAAPLVINARTDVFLLEAGPPETRLDEAVRRANIYRDAGADCLFVPGVRDSDTIGRLARSIRGPLNILATAGTPPIAELQRLGVARVSTGSGPMRAALTLAQRISLELKERGTYTSFTENVLSHAAVNRLMRS